MPSKTEDGSQHANNSSRPILKIKDTKRTTHFLPSIVTSGSSAMGRALPGKLLDRTCKSIPLSPPTRPIVYPNDCVQDHTMGPGEMCISPDEARTKDTGPSNGSKGKKHPTSATALLG